MYLVSCFNFWYNKLERGVSVGLLWFWEVLGVVELLVGLGVCSGVVVLVVVVGGSWLGG